MNRLYLYGAVALVVVAGCAEPPTIPTPASLSRVTVPKENNTSYNYTTQTLGITMGGPTHINVEGWYWYWAAPNGGSGPYLYHWFQQYCYNDIDFCSELGMVSSGIGVDSLHVEWPSYVGRMHIMVHVYDSQTYAFVGSGDRWTINTIPGDSEESDFSCDLGESFWPVIDFAGKHYRRNGCTGQREYNPDGS